MDSSTRPRSTRDRPAKPPLSEQLIVDTALQILREEGMQAVTMRRVATALDTGAASLYVYFRGRDELCDAMLSRVGASVPVQEPDPARWREQVHALLTGWLRAMEAHPGIAIVALANPPTSEESAAGAEYLMSLLLLGGIRPRDAAWACDMLPLITTATAVETATYQARGGSEEDTVERMTEAFRALDPERFPNLVAHVDDLVGGNGDDRFRYAIDTFLDGLVARSRS